MHHEKGGACKIVFKIVFILNKYSMHQDGEM
jgi:hypothetical protein